MTETKQQLYQRHLISKWTKGRSVSREQMGRYLKKSWDMARKKYPNGN